MMQQQHNQQLGPQGGAAGGLKFGQMGLGGPNANNNNGLGQQQQQHGGNGNGNGGGGVAANGGGSQDAASSANQAPEYTLAGVLHYLQSEWRRYEKDRNEWEIERAEMRARIALLEGEKRGAENLKTNLMRRVKMLEFALKQERSKYLAGGAPGPAAAVAKHPAVANLEKESALSSSGSGRSSPVDLGGDHTRGATMATLSSTLNGVPSTLSLNPTLLNRQLSTSTSASATKDYRSRERSREYLKQCLQEISYLTSATTLNPLPDRPLSGSASFVGGLPRPKKTLADEPPPPPQAAQSEGEGAGEAQEAAPASTEDAPESQPSSVLTSTGGVEDWEKLKQAGQEGRLKRENQRKAAAAAAAAAAGGVGAAEASGVVASEDPTSDTLSSERAKRLLREASSFSSSSAADDSLNDEVDAASKESQLWKMKRVLAQHRGAVRSIAFDHSTAGDEGAIIVVSASSDKTIKVSRVERSAMIGAPAPAGGASSSAARGQQGGPVTTLEGHTSLVTSVAVSSTRRRIYSGSMDSTLKVWAIPDAATSRRREDQGDDNAAEEQQKTAAATAAPLASIKTDSEILHLTLLPSTTGDDTLLATASADGMVRLYQLDGDAPSIEADSSATSSSSTPQPHLLFSWDYFGLSPDASPARESEGETLRQETGGLPVPTSISRIHSKLRECAVSYSNCVAKTFRLADGHQVSQLSSSLAQSYDSTPATQINCLASHPTLPLLFTGHEDKWLRIVDVFSGEVVGSCHAHKDAVTCLDVDPAGLKLLSGGHDGVARVWDLSRLGGSLESGSESGGSEVGSEGGGAAGKKRKAKRKAGVEGEEAGESDAAAEEDEEDEEEGIVLFQEIRDHAKAEGEGVLAVRFHPTLPFFGSAGADGVVRIYG